MFSVQRLFNKTYGFILFSTASVSLQKDYDLDCVPWRKIFILKYNIRIMGTCILFFLTVYDENTYFRLEYIQTSQNRKIAVIF